MARRSLVVVANRLPVDEMVLPDGTVQWSRSPGGLVSALHPVLRDRRVAPAELPQSLTVSATGPIGIPDYDLWIASYSSVGMGVVDVSAPGGDYFAATGTVQDAVIGRDNMGKACVQDEEIVSPRPVRIECTDGRELVFNDLAWGYDGEPMTITPPDDPSKMPEAEVDRCVAAPEGGVASEPTTTESAGG